MQLGRYQILKQLATGSVADVLLARASGLEGFARHVVIKAIRPELAHERRLVQAFLDEARIAAALHHQNIVQVHDIGEQDGAFFFAMEYIHGEDVRKLLAKVRERKEQVPLDHVVAIISATAAGLHHAHEQRNPAGEHLGLVHRDVCPANILLGYDGSVKIVDFGMAKAALRSTKTASGSLMGKASYMSPEQCCGRPIDRRTDTFALGIILYELATARRLFKGANEFMTMAAIVEGDVPPPSTIRPELPPAFDEIALRALARSPEARYQTAEDLRAALERFAIEHQLRTSNKALADYLIGMFGQRSEPWHAEAEPLDVSRESDHTHGKGLVAAPADDMELLARQAPRSTSPIMIAQTLADSVDDQWTEEDEHAPTTTARPSQEMKAVAIRNTDDEQTRNERKPSGQLPAVTPPAEVDDDPFGRTLVSPPSFADIEPTKPPAATLDSTSTPLVVPADEELSATTQPGGSDGTGELRPRSPSEGIYIGPPAPRPSRVMMAQTFFATVRQLAQKVVAKVQPLTQRAFSTYRRSVIVGGIAGLITVLIVVLAVRSCRSSGGGAPPPDAAVQLLEDAATPVDASSPPDAGSDAAPKPPKKKPTAKKPTGSGSAR